MNPAWGELIKPGYVGVVTNLTDNPLTKAVTGIQNNVLNLIYAGEGTFWTDLKSFSEAMLGRQSRPPQAVRR